MVDFSKRAAGTGDLDPDEVVLGACNVTPVPFSVRNAGLTGGLIAGGIAGAAVGAAWDRHLDKKEAAESSERALPPLVSRDPFEPAIPANGSLAAVTNRRLLAWRITGLGKPKDILFSVPLTDIDAVRWQEADKQLLRGKPASIVIWIGVGDRVLQMSGLSGGPAGKYVRSVITALGERLPGRVAEFEPPS